MVALLRLADFLPAHGHGEVRRHAIAAAGPEGRQVAGLARPGRVVRVPADRAEGRAGRARASGGRLPLVEEARSEDHPSELQSLMRTSSAVFRLTTNTKREDNKTENRTLIGTT